MVSIFRRKNFKKFVFQYSGNLPVQKNIQNQYIKNQIILIANKKYHVSISGNKINSQFQKYTAYIRLHTISPVNKSDKSGITKHII